MDKILKNISDILKFEKKFYNRKFILNEEITFISSFENLKEEILKCKSCSIHKTINNKVFGTGPVDAKLMIIGEAPGADEDREGLPFVGRAGEKLTKMLEYIGISRDEVFIANILKCRPPQNADPLPEQISNCFPFLKKQVESIRPKIILTLGRYAASVVTGGQSLRMADYLDRDLTSIFLGIPVIATYHPAVLLHSKGEKLEIIRKQIAKDMKKLKSRMDEIC
uniref:Type-4 uracil-DNA glycosylase n=1 Tax=candidate division WOR-3 bacterium TaxID=2052148 RepID=A0A7C3N4N7_UNCW3